MDRPIRIPRNHTALMQHLQRLVAAGHHIWTSPGYLSGNSRASSPSGSQGSNFVPTQRHARIAVEVLEPASVSPPRCLRSGQTRCRVVDALDRRQGGPVGNWQGA